jgi:hypothetical protein
MALHEIVVTQRSSGTRWGVILGVLVTAQYLISPEVLATVGVLSAFALVIIIAAQLRSIDRARVVHVARALLPALGIPVLILAYPVYLLVDGPGHLNGAAFPLDNIWRADLTGMVIPTSQQLVAPASVVRFGDTLAGGPLENGSYIGIPLLLLTLACLVRYWRDRWMRLVAALGAIAFVLSLGPRLVVAGHSTTILLPFDLLGRLPLLDNVLPDRISLYATFFVAVIISMGLASVINRPRFRPSPFRVMSRLMVVALTLIAVVSLFPNWPDATVNVDSAVPAFFTSSVSAVIPNGAVVLTFPFPSYPFDRAMLWQADDNWRWKMVGGYALIAAPGGPTELPPRLGPRTAQNFLAALDEPGGNSPWVSPKPMASDSDLARDLRAYVRRNRITAVVFEPIGRDPGLVLSALEGALGLPRRVAGVALWTPSQLAARLGTR